MPSSHLKRAEKDVELQNKHCLKVKYSFPGSEIVFLQRVCGTFPPGLGVTHRPVGMQSLTCLLPGLTPGPTPSAQWSASTLQQLLPCRRENPQSVVVYGFLGCKYSYCAGIKRQEEFIGLTGVLGQLLEN